MSAIRGWPSNQKISVGTGITSDFPTVVPTDPFRHALDVNRFAFRVGSSAVPRVAAAGTGLVTINDFGDEVYAIEDTSTLARVGDFVRCENGPSEGIEFPIVKVDGDLLYLAVKTGVLPQPGDDFYILRYATQRVSQDGSQLVTVVPVSYVPRPGGAINTFSANVGSAAFVQLRAPGPDAISELEIFNKTGIPLILGSGAPGSEQLIAYIGSDGISRQQIPVPAGTRLSVKTIEGTADAGWILLNAFGE